MNLLCAAVLDQTGTAIIMGIVISIDPDRKFCLMDLLCCRKCILGSHIITGLKYTLRLVIPVIQCHTGKE